jgi:hypothetical protein
MKKKKTPQNENVLFESLRAIRHLAVLLVVYWIA